MSLIKVQFEDNFSTSNSNVKIMELNDAVLEAISKGESLIIKGDESKPAVLCTSNKTFAIQQVIKLNHEIDSWLFSVYLHVVC